MVTALASPTILKLLLTTESLESFTAAVKFESLGEEEEGEDSLALSIWSSLCFQIRKKAPAKKQNPMI